MKCPNCGHDEHRAVDTRQVDDDQNAVRRRRECLNCRFRWFTIEAIETLYQKAADIVEAYRAMGRVVGREE